VTQVMVPRQVPIWVPETRRRRIDRVTATPATPTRSEFALAPALRMRLLGVLLALVGVLTALGFLLVWLFDLPGWTGGVVVVLAALGVLAAGLLLGVRRWVVRLDEHGYRVRWLRSAEAKVARWTDVLDLRATTLAGRRCLVLRLRSGSTTTIPVDLVEGDPDSFAQALSAHLDRGHGYRRLR
jgi:hypothetical protein